jgi:DNA-binding NarL/FixJ family response regulator
MLPLPTPRGVPFHSAPPKTGVRVLIADSHPVVRAGLKALLDAQPDVQLVGEAADGPDALRLAAELDPDVVVVEVSLPGLDGAQVTARLREARPEQKVLVLTGCEESGSLRLLLGVGAAGYVLKRATAEELLQAVRAVAGGGTFIDPAVAGGVLSDLVSKQAGRGPQDVELSGRERDTVRLIALGYSNKEIASRLKLSVKTIETYKTRAMEKLNMRSRVDIVRFAARRGWLTGADAATEQVAPLFAPAES